MFTGLDRNNPQFQMGRQILNSLNQIDKNVKSVSPAEYKKFIEDPMG